MKPTAPRGEGPADPGALPLAWRDVVLPSGTLRVLAPSDPDALLDALTDEQFRATDERMPYWALVWPSALVLAERVLGGPPLHGRRTLDLGSGVGTVGLAALARGARVTFLDWEARALDLARQSVAAAGHAAAAAFVACDWRSPPDGLPAFDLVLAADVLYEERNAGPVAAFLAAHLAPGGEAWLADPGRRHAAGFVERAQAAGLTPLGVETVTLPDGSSAAVHRFGKPAPPPP